LINQSSILKSCKLNKQFDEYLLTLKYNNIDNIINKSNIKLIQIKDVDHMNLLYCESLLVTNIVSYATTKIIAEE